MRWSFIDDYGDRYFMGYDLAKLNMDRFYLNIHHNASVYEQLFLYSLHKECIECPYLSTHYENDEKVNCKTNLDVGFPTNVKFRIATKYKEYFPQEDTNNVICDLDSNFGQFGIYNVEVNNTGCYVSTLKDPVNIYLPILTVVLIYALLAVLFYGIFFIWKKCRVQKKSEEKEKAPKKERVRSLDTFRGITIVLMIFVNFGGGGYEFIEHAIWNGLHAADLVFPCFMWIMGVCIPISLTSCFKKGLSNKAIFLNVLNRSVRLFCLGIFLGSGSDLNYLRIFGVLQRFGIAYLIVTTICLFCMRRSTDQNKKTNHFLDITAIAKGWLIVIIILLIHTTIILCVPPPGCPAGYMGPGGLHKNQSYTKCIGGATGYLDRLILGDHCYQQPTIYHVYESKPFDPEGIIGCLTTIFQVFLGVQAGTTLIMHKKHSQRLIRWLSWAVAVGLIGGGLCGFSKEDGVIPVNKNLWSISFVMVTSCVAFALLSFCYVLVDIKKWWSGKPFLFAGMNAILMYIGHEMTDGHFPVRWEIHNDLGDARRTHFLAILSDTWGTMVWVLVSYYLYKINYFFTI